MRRSMTTAAGAAEGFPYGGDLAATIINRRGTASGRVDNDTAR
jgi:hypothetical protein